MWYCSTYGRSTPFFQNRHGNDNLEEQAKALFNHYFIQNTENLGEWQDGVLTDIAQYLNGLAMQKYPAMPNEAGLPVLKIKELGQGQCDTNSDRCSSLIKPEYIISDGTIIFSWSGTLLVDIWCGGKCGLNQHLFKVSSAKYPQWFVFYWTKHHLNKFIRIYNRANEMCTFYKRNVQKKDFFHAKLKAFNQCLNSV